ncbi:MAG: hypothetical protein KJ796_14085 [Alphaproteobacteria bacterium]|nr:hypothetical protein [Alphaproteobacteria bacterium]
MSKIVPQVLYSLEHTFQLLATPFRLFVEEEPDQNVTLVAELREQQLCDDPFLASRVFDPHSEIALALGRDAAEPFLAAGIGCLDRLCHCYFETGYEPKQSRSHWQLLQIGQANEANDALVRN